MLFWDIASFESYYSPLYDRLFEKRKNIEIIFLEE